MDTTRIKADEIRYLRGDNWTQFEDVVIMSDTGQKFGFNRCILSSLSPLCKRLLFSLYECPLANLDEIVYISSDYTEKELHTLRNIMLSGQTMALRPDLASSFEGIGLNLNNVLASIHESLLVKNSSNVTKLRNEKQATPWASVRPNHVDPLKFEPAVEVKMEVCDDVYAETENANEIPTFDPGYSEKPFMPVPENYPDMSEETAESKPLKKPRKKKGTAACPKKKRYNVDPTGLDPEEVAKKRAIVGFDRSQCPACGKDCTSTKKAFQMHVKHEGPHHRMGKCAFCPNLKFITWDLHKAHLDLFHGGVVRLPCGQCGINFFENEKEKSGHRTFCKFVNAKEVVPSFGVEKVACTVCLAPVFNSILDIRKHMKQEHSGLGMPCPHCNDIYFDQKTLRHHVRFQHTFKEPGATDYAGARKEPFACDQCDRSFAIKSLLENHKVLHTDRRDFVCQICAKSFQLLAGLRGHIRAVHQGKKPRIENVDNTNTVTCEGCGKEILERRLRYHKKTCHSKETVKCDQCPKSFPHKDFLTEHIRSQHTPFNCPECGKSFIGSQKMNYHKLQVHTPDSEKPFVCSICTKGFVDRTKYKSHMNVHTGIKPYNCKFCDKTFADSANCNKHMRESHNQDYRAYQASKKTENRGRPIQIPRSSFDSENVAA